jgi:catechol 2,3-dioxygenase-like lactoylglutathione lyase family enzyme
MSYKPRKLGHVNIFVRNAARARDWYVDLLGLHTYGFTPGRAAFLTSDLGNSHEVALIEVGEDAPGPQKGQVGLNHMAWYMDSLDDLKELYFRIKERNIEIDVYRTMAMPSVSTFGTRTAMASRSPTRCPAVSGGMIQTVP